MGRPFNYLNIVEVKRPLSHFPVPYVEMEYSPKALETIEKPRRCWKAVHIVKGIADGLREALISMKFIHRDIKPHSILLDEHFVPIFFTGNEQGTVTTSKESQALRVFIRTTLLPNRFPNQYGEQMKGQISTS